MENKAYYIKNILKTLGIAALGLLIAELFGNSFPLIGNSAFLTGVVFAGLPFGWMALQRVFGGVLAFGIIGILIYVLLMLIGSLAIGWAILTYRLVKNSIGLIMAIRAEKVLAV